MKKLLIAIAILLIGSPLHAIEFSWGKAKLVDHYSMSGATNYDSGLNRGITFVSDYSAQINALSSLGVNTATFTASRGASNPATEIDSSGKLIVNTTSNSPRMTKGFYNTTGFVSRPGILIEAARTNLVIRTDGTAYAGAADASLWTGWNTTGSSITGTAKTNNVACPELSSISGAATQRVQYTGVVGDAPDKILYIESTNSGAATVVQNDVITISGWIRSQTGNTGVTLKLELDARNNVGAFLTAYSSADLVSSITTSWRRFTSTATVTDATADRVNLKVSVAGIGNGDAVDFEVYGIQVEKNPYATSWIPTAASALTRNAETLTYGTSGNRTAASESMFFKFTPEWTSGATVTNQVLLDTDTKARRLVNGAASDFRLYPNATDSGACITAFWTSTLTANTSYCFAGIIKHSSPYAEIYLDGTDIGKDETADDFIDPVWGSKFWVGSRNAGDNNVDGIISKVAIFNRALSASEVAAVTNELNR